MDKIPIHALNSLSFVYLRITWVQLAVVVLYWWPLCYRHFKIKVDQNKQRSHLEHIFYLDTLTPERIKCHFEEDILHSTLLKAYMCIRISVNVVSMELVKDESLLVLEIARTRSAAIHLYESPDLIELILDASHSSLKNEWFTPSTWFFLLQNWIKHFSTVKHPHVTRQRGSKSLQPSQIKAPLITDYYLIHWGRMSHICVSKHTMYGSNNGLSPDRCQSIIWTNAGKLLIRILGIDFGEIFSEIHLFSFMKMYLKTSSAKWPSSCLGINALINVGTCSHGLYWLGSKNWRESNGSYRPPNRYDHLCQFLTLTWQGDNMRWDVAIA